MRRLFAIIVLSVSWLGAGSLRGAVGLEGWTIDSRDEGAYFLDTGVATVTNGVSITYGGTTLTAEKATVNTSTGEASAEGNVRISRGGREWAGSKVSYNFKTGRIQGDDFRGGQPPFFVGGDLLVGDQKAGIYAGSRGFVTTDDYAEPGYRIMAKTILVVPGDYIEAKGATLYYGDLPVFYFPYYRRNLGRHPNNWVFVPGYRSLYGPYLLSTYNWYGSEKLDAAVHLDGRLKRGFGVGPDFGWRLPKLGEGEVRSYYAHDEDPGTNSIGQDIDPDRYRVYFGHRVNLGTNFLAKGMVRYQSDEYFVRDFFESEYQENVRPSTFVEADRLFPNFDLNVYAQPRVNDFFETVERLPDVKLSAFRQQLGYTPLYYEGESSAAYLQRKFAYDLTNAYSAFRADTFHQVVWPWNFFGWLNLSPRVGGRFTYYSDANGEGATTDEESRGVFNTGMEMSFRASRLWPEVQSEFWQIDGVRHIIEPSVNYVYVPSPSELPAVLPQFDYQLPTTRLLPVEYPDYNSIDSIDAQNVFRFTLNNRLQTKRQRAVRTFFNWLLQADWRLDPLSGQQDFSDVYSLVDYEPFEWLTLGSDTRYNVNEKRWDEANHSITLTPSMVWSVSLGHRYLLEMPGQGRESGNNLIVGSLYYRVNENWCFRLSEQYDVLNGFMQEQRYTLYRDLRSWTGALSFRVRQNLDGPMDYTAAFTFSLKAFPRFAVGEDRHKPALLLGN